MALVLTKAALLKQNVGQKIETVVYERHKSTKKPKVVKEPEVVQEERYEPDLPKTSLDMQRARHDIMKFAMTGFTAARKEKTKVQLAIKLGAKPPKNKERNYKEILKGAKQKKKQIEDRRKLQELGKNSMGRSTAKGKSYDRKRRKEARNTGLLDVYGKVKRSEIKKIKG